MMTVQKYSRILIAATMCVVAIALFVYSHGLQFGEDEITYGYICDMGRTGKYNNLDAQSQPIATVSDVIHSQINHYHYNSGRIVPHVINQLFDGVLPVDLFYALNALVFALTIYLMVRYAAPGRLSDPLVWIVVLVFMIYLTPYPVMLITSVNRSPNYLWSAAMTMAFILVWQSLRRGHRYSPAQVAMLSVMSFVCALTHEAFVLPVAGSIILSLVWEVWRTRRLNLSGGAICILAGYVLGASLMVSSPGHFSRLGQETGGDTGILVGVFVRFDQMLRWPLTYILGVSVLLIMCVRGLKKRLLPCLLSHKLQVGFVALSFGMAWVFFGGRALYSAVFFTTMLLAMLLARLLPVPPTRLTAGIATVIAVIVSVHLCLVTRQQKIIDIEIERVTNDYVSSPDGICAMPNFKPKWWAAPFVRTDYAFLQPSFDFQHSLYSKHLRMFGPVEMAAFADAEAYFVAENVKADGSGFYQFDTQTLWAQVDSVPAGNYYLHLAPIDYSQQDIGPLLRIKHMVFPADDSLNHCVAKIDTLQTRWGRYLMIAAPNNRRIQSVDYTPTR